MYCPKCGQERLSHDTSFCSRCGFLLTGTSELLQTGGVIPSLQAGPRKRGDSPRSRGIKQGLFIFLLTFLVVPLVALISVALRLNPTGVAMAAIILFVGGLLRMAYAAMFESTVSDQMVFESNAGSAQGSLNQQPVRPSLPPQQSIPASAYVAPPAGTWRDTNDLLPTSVTEGTTKLLEKDQ